MRTTNLMTSVLLLLAAFYAQSAGAQSLWPSDTNRSLTTDLKASQVGDVVTILISEVSSANQQATSSTARKTKTTAGPGTGPILNKIPELAYEAGSTTSGTGATTRSTNLTARISARITRVNPDGTLLVEGTRQVKVNNDTQLFRITGVIRRADIRPDNTVPSSALADAQIESDGKGPIAQRQKPGFISQILNWLF